MRPFRPVVVPLCALMVSWPLDAQEPQRPAITGVVRDTTGAPIANAQVSLGTSGQRALTGVDGRFRLSNVEAGRHFVTTRRIGYYPETQIAVVDTVSVEIRYDLIPVARVLPVVVASAARGGISGVVHDSALTRVRGANITALGSGNRRATSDTAGAFHLDVKPGQYMLEIVKQGFATRLVSVTVSRDSGRHMIIGLSGATSPSLVRERVAITSLRERLVRLRIRSNQVFTREDLDKLGDKQLNHLAAYSTVRIVDDRCWALIDGDPHRRVPLYAVHLPEVEMVEIYSSEAYGSSKQQKAGMRSNARWEGLSGCPSVYVWLRK